jgi:hypothetical protein
VDELGYQVRRGVEHVLVGRSTLRRLAHALDDSMSA